MSRVVPRLDSNWKSSYLPKLLQDISDNQLPIVSLSLFDHLMQKSSRVGPRVRGGRAGQLQPGGLRDGAGAPRHALHHQLLSPLGTLRRRLLDLIPRPRRGPPG